ncbi:MAG: Acetyltransferase family [Actinomycetota bacterium]|jgi:ribosomal protein S18 acetylase RimI-like enzyme
MSEIFVRTAVESDLGEIARLEDSARSEESLHRGSWLQAPGVAASGRTVTLVGGLGVSVLGMARAKEGDEGRWVVSLVHVEPAGRGVGIGDALITSLLDRVRGLGGRHLAGSAQPGDRALKNLYERNGMVAQTILVGRDLS